jgi:Zn-dependent protease
VVVATQFPEAYLLWRRLLLGVAASLIFGAAISIRQIALTFVLWRRIPLKNVTLFVFGGVPAISKEATQPILEILLAMAGLLSTLIVVVLFYLVYIILITTGSVMMSGLIQWLTFISVMLTLFHFVPAFPLDGGRVLRAVLWRATGNYEQATRITSRIGQGVGVLLIAGGITLLIMSRGWFTGLVLAFVGWVLYIAAAQSNRQILLREALRNVTAGDIMSKEFPVITPELSLGKLVRDYVLVTGQRHFVVIDGAQLRGCVTMRNMKSVRKKRRGSTRVGQIMTPADRLDTAQANQSAAALLDQMDELRLSQMLVMEGEKVVGIVTRDRLIRLSKTRAELRM